jgi:hypothetical protein
VAFYFGWEKEVHFRLFPGSAPWSISSGDYDSKDVRTVASDGSRPYGYSFSYRKADLTSVVVKALCYKAEGLGFETIYLILLATLGPVVYSECNKN